jgi:hypothetical protein
MRLVWGCNLIGCFAAVLHTCTRYACVNVECPRLLSFDRPLFRRYTPREAVGLSVNLCHLPEVGWASASATSGSVTSSAEKLVRTWHRARRIRLTHLAQSIGWMSMTSSRTLGAKLRYGNKSLDLQSLATENLTTNNLDLILHNMASPPPCDYSTYLVVLNTTMLDSCSLSSCFGFHVIDIHAGHANRTSGYPPRQVWRVRIPDRRWHNGGNLAVYFTLQIQVLAAVTDAATSAWKIHLHQQMT